jgi:hypothetical protein
VVNGTPFSIPSVSCNPVKGLAKRRAILLKVGKTEVVGGISP